MAAQTKFDVASRALTRVGAGTVSAFGTASAEEIACAQEYEGRATAALSAHRWRFATDIRDLGNPLVDAPAARYGYAFQLPADLLILDGVYLLGTQTTVEYDRFGSKIFTDESSGLAAEFGFRAAEANWPPYFTDAFVADLAAVFAVILGRDSALSAELANLANEILWPRARTMDSQQQTTRRVVGSRLVGIRR